MSSGPARATRLWRIADYLGEMFPPAFQIPIGAASFASVYFGLQALGGATRMTVGWRALGGAATVILFSLLMRVYDELKDVETDLRLARAGDPRYKDRAIVTGRVQVADLVALRWTVTALLGALNLTLGFPWPLLAFLGLFAVGWLSFRWFFWPAVSRNLLLAFLTHNPIALLVGAYVVAVYVADFGAASLPSKAALLLLAGWAPIAAWETSRKVRHPTEETEYQTYSKLLGWRTASLLPAAFVLVGTAALLVVASAAGLGWGYRGVVLVGAMVPLFACVRFRLAPSPARARLRPFVEIFAAVVHVGLAIALVGRYGVAWR